MSNIEKSTFEADDEGKVNQPGAAEAGRCWPDMLSLDFGFVRLPCETPSDLVSLCFVLEKGLQYLFCVFMLKVQSISSPLLYMSTTHRSIDIKSTGRFFRSLTSSANGELCSFLVFLMTINYSRSINIRAFRLNSMLSVCLPRLRLTSEQRRWQRQVNIQGDYPL